MLFLAKMSALKAKIFARGGAFAFKHQRIRYALCQQIALHYNGLCQHFVVPFAARHYNDGIGVLCVIFYCGKPAQAQNTATFSAAQPAPSTINAFSGFPVLRIAANRKKSDDAHQCNASRKKAVFQHAAKALRTK